MNTPGNSKQTNNSRKPTTSRKNHLIFIGLVLLIATALAWSALINSGIRVASPSRSARNASLPATPRTARRQDTGRGVFADGIDSGTAPLPGSSAADRDRIEKRPVTNTVVSVDREAPGVASTTAPISSSNREVDLSSTSAGPMRAPRVPTRAMIPGLTRNNGDSQQESSNQQDLLSQNRRNDDNESGRPREARLTKAHPFKGDVRNLPRRRPVHKERPEREDPETERTLAPGTPATGSMPEVGPITPPTANPPAPPPIAVFEGLDREFWGAGSPPDTNGDVGPTYYIQTVNTSIGIYDKAGNQQAAFTFDTLMSQGNFGNQCDTENFGDPVVLYDTFEDRWILTDFAFTLDGTGAVNPPIAYQCFAVSQSGNPLSGGWNFYSITVTDGLNDYPKFGIWTDGLYMSANVFGYAAGGSFITARAWAFNKQQMYAGSPTVQVVAFNVPGGDFTVVPSNARLQTGTPPPGRPNLFLSSWLFTNALTVYKFHVDWNSISQSTFTGPDTPIAATSWPNAAVANAPQPGTATLLDVLQIRAMVQNQYTNFGGTESLWVPHTVRRANTTGFAAPRWYQVNVNGGTVNPAIPQAATWDPDGANTNHRFMPSLALNRNGDMAMGYSISNSTTRFPSMAYAGRLAADPVNTFGQTETFMFTGTASQTGSSRWGDYSAMTLDPDGCTFWYTNEYANPADQTAQKRWKTKIGSFAFPGCTTFGAGGTVTGTVTVTPGGTPISGATVNFGARTATTNGSGVYSFLNIPAGTYPSISATKPGFSTASAASIVVTDAGTTTQDFALTDAADSACLTDTTQADFLTGVFTTVDLNTSPGDVTLQNLAVDQQNTAGTTTGTGFGTPAWTGQTFIPAVTGQLVKAEIQVFCNGCGGTPPNLTLSVRATAAGLPTGADLASVTIPGSNFASGATVAFTASFGVPATLTSGTQYALILRPVSAPAGAGYFWIRSSPSTYASGSRVLSANSGATWTADTTRDYNFKAYIQGPYSPTSGNLISSVKDANPTAGLTPIWATLSWNGTTPANTSLQFKVAGSNNVNGPFNFVGPDGTAATFFTTSPASLTQFYNFRYLKYKVFLATTNNAVTPTLNDVTLCFNDVDCSSTNANITAAPEVCQNTTGNTASGPAGMTSYAWSITNGTITSATNIQSITYTAGAAGNVQLMLNVVAPNGCRQSNSINVAINPFPPTPTITPGGPTTFCAGGSVLLTSSSASGNQWYLDSNPIGGATNSTYNATAQGNYTVLVTTNGCPSPFSAGTSVTVNPIPPTPTITPGGPTTFGTGGSVTLTSSSASGNQWYLNGNPIGGETNQNYVATASGNYTVVVTISGCSSAPSAATTVTVCPSAVTVINANDSGAGSLRQAIADACDGATITFNMTSVVSPITLTTGELVINKNLTITGPGANVLTISGNNASRVFSIQSGKTVTISGLTLTNGNVGGGDGGGVLNFGTLILTNCTVTGNTGGGTGGGVTNATGGTLTITGSTISGNTAPEGAGIFNAATLTLINSTISGNTGDGLSNGTGGVANLTNDTFSGNSIRGITSNPGSTTNIRNTIVVNTPGAVGDVDGTFNSQGNNFIGKRDGSAGLTNGVNNDQVGTIATPLNALLAALGDYGGSTQTHALLPGSTAIDTANNCVTDVAHCGDASIPQLTTDQRGLARQVNGTVDIGAFESRGFTIAATSGTPQSTAINTAFGAPLLATVSSAFNEPVIGGQVTFTAPGAGASATFTGGVTTISAAINGSSQASMTATANGTAGGPYNVTAGGNGITGTANFSLTNLKANQTITFGGLANKTFGDADFGVSATATSTLAVSFTASGDCTLIGGATVHLTGAGSCTITAKQAGDTNYNPALDVPQSFSIAKANQTITFGALGNKTFGDADFGVSATASSTLAVSFTASGNCTLIGGATVHLTGGGSCTITAKQAGDTNYNPAPDVPQSFSIAKANQTITFGALGNKTFGDADFGVSATASSTLAVNFTASGNCTLIGGATVHLTGAGSCTITAKQAGDTNYNPAPDVPQIFSIAKANQTITFGALGNKTFGDADFGVSATASSTLAVNFTASGNCTLIGGATVHLTGAGSCTITAKQAGDTNYNPALDVPQSFSIAKANQTITFGALGNKTFGDADFGVGATATSSLAVSFTASGNCTVTGSTVHITGVGSCTITAKQAGDTNYNPAPDVPQSFSIAKANQTITFGALGNKTFGDADFGVVATATSSLAVSFTASGNCTVTGSTVHITGVGSCTITAKQAGDTNYNPAPDVPQSFSIAKANQTITFGALGAKTFGDADFGVGATATSSLSVSFTASGNCTITGSTVHITGAGSCTITAKQAGDASYNSAPDVPQSFNVAQANTTIGLTSSLNPADPAQSVTFTATIAGPAGTGTPTGTVQFKDNGSAITCANAGGQTLNASGLATCQTSSLAPGAHTITAEYNGDSNFLTSTATLSGGQVINNQALLSFSQANQSVNEATGFITITVNRTGDVSAPVTVDYATDDTGAPNQCAPVSGNTLASSRCDFGITLGTLRFAASETQKSFMIPITQDAYSEGPENFTVSLSNPTGGAALTLPPTATVTINDSTSATPNAIDDTETFVRQQYRDFLNREADPSGLAFWKNNIDKCNDPAQRPPGQTVAQCIEVQRILTSAAFFLSIEFKGTGGLVRDFYVAALDRPLTNNMPDFVEFMRDTEAIQKGVVVGQGNWQQVLDTNRLAFMNEFVTRAEFLALYPTTDTPTQYVDKLYQHARVTGTQQERLDAIAYFGGAATAADTGARARALLRVTQSGDFQAREANRTFVQIEYFGYLRRNPNDPPDNNFNGFNFWVNKMNQFQGDFLQAEMVKAFLSSLEYRRRFGQ